MVYFGPLHLALERETKESTGRGDTFRTAAATIAIHGITPSSLSGAAMGTNCIVLVMNIINQFDGSLKSLASAATNGNVVLKRLTAATTTQYTDITKLTV